MHMLDEKTLRFLAGATHFSRAKGYVRNGRACLTHHSETLCEGIVSGLGAYAVTLVHKDDHFHVSCDCPQRKGRQVRIHASLPLHTSSSIPDGQAVLCAHAAALCLLWKESVSSLEARPATLSGQGDGSLLVQVLLYWHEVLEEIRVIPRVVWRDGKGRIVSRIHPLASVEDHQQFPGDNDVDGVLEREAILDFFARWPGWVADENGFLTLRGIEGALTVLTEVVPLFPEQWSVLLDQKLERMRPRRVVVQSVIRMENPGVGDLLEFDIQFHCRLLGLTQSQLEAFIRGQQLWLIDGGQYVQIANLEKLRAMLRLLPQNDSEDSLEDTRTLSDAQLAAELMAWAEEQEEGAVRFEGLLGTLLRDHSGQEVAFPVPELPEVLHHTLRPWQRMGVGWLTLMAENGFGCVLGDDMGLGKTLQALAFLRGRLAKDSLMSLGEVRLAAPGGVAGNRYWQGRRPSLLLCPKSLLFNWLQEARRFVPELRVLLVHGSTGERLRRIRSGLDADLVITTYPLFLTDWEQYKGFVFDSFLLDEAQLIRNPNTRLSRHVRKINASFRLALTGTPIENSPLDLWSIFDFVMPGFLGTQAHFRTRCQEGPAVWPRLVRRVRPFLLRRTKQDVLPELPARTEVDIPVELTQNQLALYEHTRAHIRAGFEEMMSERGAGAAWIEFLAGLTRLRQICDHPGLVQEAWRGVQGVSGKMEAFETLISQCLEGGHKVLVFSQFAQMLRLLESHLDRKRIPCLRLDGQTVDRQQLIDQFNRDPGMPVFLISLKAGGFGLNLTAADTVILFDPWWNPMVEEQAADRAHRYGQTRPVTVYRLIAKGTIETRMQELKERKREMFEAIVNGAAGERSSLSREELESLLD